MIERGYLCGSDEARKNLLARVYLLPSLQTSAQGNVAASLRNQDRTNRGRGMRAGIYFERQRSIDLQARAVQGFKPVSNTLGTARHNFGNGEAGNMFTSAMSFILFISGVPIEVCARQAPRQRSCCCKCL